jgi:hypothetical protein
MNEKQAQIIHQLRNRLAELGQDVQADIWYDASTFEKDYPNDGYSEIMDSICTAPNELSNLLDELVATMR